MIERFTTPRRLHPASVVLGVDPRHLIQNYLVPAFATFAVAGFTLTVLAVVGLVALTVRLLAWQRFTFAFDGEVLRVHEGVVSRSHRTLDVDRIQQVEVDRGFAERLLGLATLRVETAGTSPLSGGAVELRVINEEEAVALRNALRGGRTRATGHPGEDVEHREEILRVPLRHVVLGAITGARLLVLPAVVAGAFQFTGPRTERWLERVAEEAARRGFAGSDVEVTATALLLAAFALVACSVLAAAGVGILRDAGFRATLVEGDLHVSRGLLSTRSSVLPLRRIQLARIQRNWARRLLGYASVRIYSAGGSGQEERRVTVPLLPDGEVDRLVAALYDGTTGIPALSAHPRSARRRAVFRWLRSTAIVVGAVWLAPFAWAEALRLPSLLLLAPAGLLGVVEYRLLAHGTSERLIAARRGALSVTTSVAPLAKVQGATTSANPFQRRLDLATVTAHIAGPGGAVEVLDAGADAATALWARLAEHAARPLQSVAEETAARALADRAEPAGGR